MKSGESRVLKHVELFRLMKGLKYKSSDLGICHGYACMAAQAHLVGETDVFIERLCKIAHLIDYTAYNLGFQGRQKESTGALIQIAQELKIGHEKKLETFFSRNKGRKVKAPLPQEIADGIDMFAFMDGVELYFQSYLYPHLFEPGKAPAKGAENMQAALLTSALVAPKMLTEETSMTALDSFSGIYDHEDLEKYFEFLKQSIGHANTTHIIPRMALILSSSDHTITVGFDHEKKQWFFADANNEPQYYPLDQCTDIAKAVHWAFSRPHNYGHVSFNTSCLAEKNACELLRPILKDWNEHRVTSINRISKERMELKDVHTSATWLDTALLNNDCNVALQCLLILEKKPVTFPRNLRKEELWELKKGIADIIYHEEDLGKKAWMLKLALNEKTALGKLFFTKRGLLKPSIKREGNILYELNLAYERLPQEYKVDSEADITSLRKSSIFSVSPKEEIRHGKRKQESKINKGK